MREIPFQFPLSDQETSSLIAALGNHEGKAMLLAGMASRPGEIFKSPGMASLICRAQEIPYTKGSPNPDFGWKINPGTLYDYCRESLLDIGLVAQEVTDDGHLIGYAATSRGVQLGLPLAGLLLDYSTKMNTPLSSIWCQSVSREPVNVLETADGQSIEYKERPPSRVFRIYWELMTSDRSQSISSLAQAVGETESGVGMLCRSLCEAGMITLDTKAPTPVVKFGLAKEIKEGAKPPTGIRSTFNQKNTVSKALVEILTANPERQYLLSELHSKLIEIGFDDITPEQTLSALWYLKRKKWTEAFEGELTNDRSQVYLQAAEQTSTGLDQVAKVRLLVETIDSFQQGEKQILQRGRDLAFAYLHNPDLARTALDRARRASAKAQGYIAANIVSFLEEIITEAKPERIRTLEFRKLLKANRNIDVGADAIRKALALLKKDGYVDVIKVGRDYEWFSTS